MPVDFSANVEVSSQPDVGEGSARADTFQEGPVRVELPRKRTRSVGGVVEVQVFCPALDDSPDQVPGTPRIADPESVPLPRS